MALKDFSINGHGWFDQAPTADASRNLGLLSILGRTLQGVAAPMAAAYGNDSGYKALALQQQQDQADIEFQRYLAQKNLQAQSINAMKPVYTTGSNGELISIGSVPKGAQVISPSSMQTPEQKAKEQIESTTKKDVIGRATKLQELLPILDTYGQMLEAVPTGTGMQGKAEGIKQSFLGKLQIDPISAGIKSQIDAVLPQIARGMSEVGNLNEFEQKRAKGFIPLLEDSEDTRAMKELGGYIFLKNKLTQSASRSGLSKDSTFSEPIKQLDNKIKIAYKKASDLGVDEKRLNKFLGSNGLDKKDLPPKGNGGVVNKASGYEIFNVNGKKYYIPRSEITEFKKDMGIK